jgi:DNA-binding NarL/FixJ family response regulator
MRALRAGAHGYILKSADEQELLDGILKVTQGHMVLGQGVAERIVGGLIGGQPDPTKINEQERQVLLQVAAGLENADIGKALQLPLTVVIETLAQAMNKLGAKDRNSAALQALREGYISLEELHDL